MAEWISVKERVPGWHEYVLCCGSKGGMFVGYVCASPAEIDIENRAYAFQHGGKGRYITHWMPLPEPPKEG